MCGRFTVTNSRLINLEAALAGKLYPAQPGVETRYNIAPSQPVYVVRGEGDGKYHFLQLKWGLVPAWSKEPKVKYNTSNAKAETIETLASYRTPFRKRRCLIPATGWYEWQPRPSGKVPWYLYMGDHSDFAFAGLWEKWEKKGQILETCTIIVTDACESIREIHYRMPVILDPIDYEHWLDPGISDPALLKPLLRPYKRDRLVAHPVSRRVNQVSNDDRSLIEPVGDAN